MRWKPTTPSDPPSDTMTLGCPECPRRTFSRRRRQSTYRRVTPWAGDIARYRCNGCGFEHAFTADWVRRVTTPARRHQETDR